MDETVFPHRKWMAAYFAAVAVAVVSMVALVAYSPVVSSALGASPHMPVRSAYIAGTVMFFLMVPFALLLATWAGAIFLAPPLFTATCLRAGKWGYALAGASAGALHFIAIASLRAINIDWPMHADVWLIGAALLSKHPALRELVQLGAFELVAGAAAGTVFGLIFLSPRRNARDLLGS